MKILVINPGSTSTKIAVFEDETKLVQENLSHTPEELGNGDIMDQAPMRKRVIASFLERNGYQMKDFAAVVGRGGILPPVRSGGYLVDENLLDALKHRTVAPHASNLGGVVAYELASSVGIPSYIYDSIAVDELSEMAHLSGTPLLPRISHFHALNSRAVAIETAAKAGKEYKDMNFVVAHMGGGISTSAHQKGRVVDITSDDEGTFSPQRAGRVNTRALVDLCYSGKFDRKAMQKQLRGQGGLFAYLGLDDAREVEKKIAAGDEYSALVYEAMAYQIAKDIASMAAVLEGQVDCIILTGGLAYSKMLTDWVKKRVAFIAPVELLPGEKEMEALAGGALRILTGKEEARVYEG